MHFNNDGVGSAFQETATIGGFEKLARQNNFDDIFSSAYEQLAQEGVNVMHDINKIVENEHVRNSYKEALLGNLREESEQASLYESAGDPRTGKELSQGTRVGLYDQVSQLFDNQIDTLVKESMSVGSLLPIKTLDLPILVKEHLKLVAKDIIQTEVTPSPVIRKHLEQTYIYSAQNPNKRWKYPQCFFSDEFKEIYNEGKGVKIDETKKVNLPAINFNVVETLTDLTGEDAKKAILSFNTEIIGGTVEVTLKDSLTKRDVDFYFTQPIVIDLSTNQWKGGKINQTIVDEEGTTHTVTDQIFGSIDLTSKIATVMSTGTIKSVIFSGYLSNEANERHVRFAYEREEREWKIEDGTRADMPLSLEELEDHKALLNVDMYKKTYNTMTDYLADQEDSDILDYLDKMFDRYKGVELNPLEWNSLVIEDKFDAEAGHITTALPSEYIQSQLKFKIDSMIIDLADTVKMENLTFVIYGNPRYIRFLDSSINWVARPGSTSNGVKLDYGYGIMTTNNIKVQVVSTKKVQAKYDDEYQLHRGLRIIPFPTTDDQMTFKHYKYTSHIQTAANSAYRAPDLPGGSQTYFMGVSRYKNVAVQGIQMNLYLSNFEQYITMGLKSSELVPPEGP